METVELEDVQGIVAYGYVGRPQALYALLRVDGASLAERRRWLERCRAQVRSARVDNDQERRESDRTTLAIAFSYEGLAQFGLDAESLATFAPGFRQGMAHPHRARVLGDVGDNAPSAWRWGNGAAPVHVFVAAYGSKCAVLEAELQAGFPPGFVCVHSVCSELKPYVDSAGVVHRKTFVEPFGFRDGISNPHVEAFGRPALQNAAEQNRVAAGEFVFGYLNQLRRTSLVPALSVGDARGQFAGAKRERFGRNGSMLAVRELDQDVARFDAENSHPDAAKLLGLAPDRDQPDFGSANDFGYYAHDRAGLRCPLGAHVRRSNPRDSFADPTLPTTEAEAVATANEHRLLRRGRPFTRASDGGQGLFFMCLNTDLERQFEFVQQSWLGSPIFAGLTDERDLATGMRTSFTTPTRAKPERRNLSSYVTVRGGGYFFLPGLRALRYIAEVGAP
jgi:deferrochelatase/peroxidase EfeB